MATAAAIAAAAIGAAGSIAGGVISSQGAQAAARAGKGRATKFPLPNYQRGFERYYTRLLAENLTGVPPTFADFVRSGGTAKFPLQDTGMSPLEARQLGAVGKHGETVPFVPPGTTELSPEQRLYLGQQMARRPGQDPNDPLVRAFRLNQRIGRIEGREDTAQRDARIARLRTRRDRLLSGMPGGLL